MDIKLPCKMDYMFISQKSIYRITMGIKTEKGREREQEYFNVVFVTLVLLQGIL